MFEDKIVYKTENLYEGRIVFMPENPVGVRGMFYFNASDYVLDLFVLLKLVIGRGKHSDSNSSLFPRDRKSVV